MNLLELTAIHSHGVSTVSLGKNKSPRMASCTDSRVPLLGAFLLIFLYSFSELVWAESSSSSEDCMLATKLFL